MSINYSKIIENDFEKPIYKDLHIKILNYLDIHNNCSFWDIIHFVGGSERRMIRLLNEMVENKEIFIANDIVFKKNGKTINCICDKCKGKTIICDEMFKNIFKQLTEIYEKKPKPTFIFDQRPTNIQTTLNRCIYMLNRGDIFSKDVVLLGDDDLTGIAIALTHFAKSVLVLDIDERLINYVNTIAREYNLNLSAIKYDATTPLPNNLKNKFDTLLTDPTPEIKPFAIFVNKAISLTKNKASLYFSIYSSAMNFDFGLQEVMTERKLHITDMLPYWTEYKNIKSLYKESDLNLFNKFNINIENKICFTETFIRTTKTPQTKILDVDFTSSDLFGKATKRVIADSKNDVECLEKNDYLSKCLETIKEEQ